MRSTRRKIGTTQTVIAATAALLAVATIGCDNTYTDTTVDRDVDEEPIDPDTDDGFGDAETDEGLDELDGG